MAWLPPSDGLGATGYLVEVGRSSGAADVMSTTVGALSVVVPDLMDGDYFVRVRTVRGGAIANATPELTVSINAGVSLCLRAPAAPTEFSATSQGSLVNLQWQPGNGPAPTSYMLYVGTGVGRADLLTVPLGALGALSATAADGVYFLRLVAMNECGASPGGADAVLLVGVSSAGASSGANAGQLPGAPEGLTSTVVGTTVTLSWRPPTTGGTAARYIIEAMTAGGPVAVDVGNATSFTHPDTPPGEYVVRVRAANAAGAGVTSQAVTVIVP